MSVGLLRFYFGYEYQLDFGLKLNILQEHYCSLRIEIMLRCPKLGMILESKMSKNFLSKTVKIVHLLLTDTLK